MAVLPITSTTGDPVFRAQNNSINVIKRFTRVGSDAGVKLNNGERIVNPGDDALSFSASRRIRSDLSALKVVAETGQLNATGIGIAINGLDLMKTQLDKIKKSLVQAQSATAEERALIQAEIDLALSQIDSVSSSTKLGNRGLLNGQSTVFAAQSINTNSGGALDFNLLRNGTAPTTAEGIRAVRINKLGTGLGAVKTLADGRKVASLVVSFIGTSRGSRASITVNAGAAGGFTVFRVTGKYGSATIRIDSSAATLAQISGSAAFNALAEQTGVVLTSGTALAFVSLGSSNQDFVKVEVIDSDTLGTGADAAGADQTGESVVRSARAGQIRINGQEVILGGELGLTARFDKGGFDMEIDIDGFDINDAAQNTSFRMVIDLSSAITGVLGTGGAPGDTVRYGFGTFNTSTLGKGQARALITSATGGTTGNTLALANVGQRIIGAHSVGNMASGGSLSLVSGNTTTALRVIDRAVNQIVSEQARLGIIQSSFISSISNAETAIGNLSSAEADIIGVDAATEITNLIQAQLGISTASSVLSQANAIQANIFSLLRG